MGGAEAAAALLGEAGCGPLEIRPGDEGLLVAGRVPDEAARRRLLETLGRLEGAGAVAAGGLDVLPDPHCGALRRLGTALSGAALEWRAVPGPRRFADGAPMSFVAEAPGHAAHMTVDYFDADGMVVHLVPSRFYPEARLGPDGRLVIGAPGDPGGPELAARAGPGTDLLLVVATERALFDRPRPLSEPAADYLPGLAAALAREAGAGRRVSLAHLAIAIAPAGAGPTAEETDP